MSQKTFLTVAGIVFSFVAVLHFLRLLLRWEAMIGGWVAPMWVSGVALAVSGYLAFFAFKLRK